MAPLGEMFLSESFQSRGTDFNYGDLLVAVDVSASEGTNASHLQRDEDPLENTAIFVKHKALQKET